MNFRLLFVTFSKIRQAPECLEEEAVSYCVSPYWHKVNLAFNTFAVGLVQEFQLETGGRWGDVPLHKLQYLNQTRKCMWTTALWSCIEGLIILHLLTEAVWRLLDKKKSFELWAMSILEAWQVPTMTCIMVMETLWFTTLILKNCLPANKTVLQRGTIWGWFCWWLGILRMRGH